MVADDGAADSPLSPFSSFPSPPPQKKRPASERPTWRGAIINCSKHRSGPKVPPAHWPLSYEGGRPLSGTGEERGEGKEEWRM